MYNGGEYRLLFVSKDEYVNDDGTISPGCGHCEHFAQRYEQSLIEAIKADNRVSYSRIPYVTVNKPKRQLIPLPYEKGGARVCHPKLISYILGFPTFILVNDANFRSQDPLEVRVFGRISKNGKYELDPEQNYTPMNLLRWIREQMKEIEAHIAENHSLRQYEAPLIKNETLYAHQGRKYCPGFSE